MRNSKRILAIITSLALIISALSFSLLTVSGEETESTNFYAALDFENTDDADLVVRNDENPSALLMQELRTNSQLQLRSDETGKSLVHSVYAWADLFLHLEERADAKLASALAFFLDMTDARYSATLNDVYLYEKNGEVYRGYAAGSVLLVDEAGCVELQFDSADDKQVIPANFKGWVVLSKEFFKTHESYVARTKNGILELDKVNSLGIDITYGSNAGNPDNIVFDNFGYIVNVDEFIESVGADRNNKNMVYSGLLADSVITNIENYNGYSTEATLDGEKAVYFEGNANGQYAIEFDVTFPNKADVLASMDYVDALALRVKFTGNTEIYSLQVLESIGGNPTERRSATAIYVYDNNTATKYIIDGNAGTHVSPGFDGWIIVPFSAFGTTAQSIVDNDAFDPVNLCHVYIDDWYANADKTITMSKFALVNLEDFVGFKDVAFDSTYSDLNNVSDIPSGLIGEQDSGSNAPDKEIVELDGKNALKLSCSGWSYFTLKQSIPNKVADPKYIAFRVDYNLTNWDMQLSESNDITLGLSFTELHKISAATLINAADMSTETVTELPNAFNGWIVVDMESGLPNSNNGGPVGSSDKSVFDYEYFNRIYVRSNVAFDHFTYGGVAIAKDYDSMVAYIENASKKPDVYFDEPYTGLDTISDVATKLNNAENSSDFGYVIADDYLDGKNALKVTDSAWGQYAVDATFPTDKVSSVGAVAIRVKYEGLWSGADGICFSEYGKKLESVNEANASELSNIASATLIHAADLSVENVNGLPGSFDGWIVIDTNSGFVKRNAKTYGNDGFEAENVVGIYVGANENNFAISTTAVAIDCDEMVKNIKALYKTNDKVAFSDSYKGLDDVSNNVSFIGGNAIDNFVSTMKDDYLDGKNAVMVTDTHWNQYVINLTMPTDKISSVGTVAIRVDYEGVGEGGGIIFCERSASISTSNEVNASQQWSIAEATLIHASDLTVETTTNMPTSFDGWIVVDVENGFSMIKGDYGTEGFDPENVVGLFINTNNISNSFAISGSAVATDYDEMLKYITGDTDESEEAPAYKEFSGHSDMKYPVWIEVNGEKLASANWTVLSNGTVKILESVCADGATVKYRDAINEYTWNAGSWSQLYAPNLLFGDVTGEGKVDILDLVASKNAVEGNITVKVPTAMDVSFDFANDEQDVLSIRKLLIGKSVYYGNTDSYKTLSDIIAE